MAISYMWEFNITPIQHYDVLPSVTKPDVQKT